MMIYFRMKQRQIVPLLITKAFSWRLYHWGGTFIRIGVDIRNTEGFALSRKHVLSIIISSFRLWQQYCDFEVKIALLNSFDIFSEDLSQNLVYLRVS